MVDSIVDIAKVVNPQTVEAMIEEHDWETIDATVVEAPVDDLADWSLSIFGRFDDGQFQRSQFS